MKGKNLKALFNKLQLCNWKKSNCHTGEKLCKCSKFERAYKIRFNFYTHSKTHKRHSMNVFPVEELSVTTHPIKYMSKFTLVKKT